MNDRKPRVCVVAPLYHPLLGGLGRQAMLLTERLAGMGVDIFVVARRMKGMPPATFSPKVKVYRAWAIRPYIHTFENVNPLNIFISFSFSLSCLFLLIGKRREYDIVHFHGASLPLFICLPIVRLLRKRCIALVGSANLGIEAGSLRGRYAGIGTLMSKSFKGVDSFIAISSEIERNLLAEGFSPEKLQRIPNAIDFATFFPGSPEERKSAKERVGLSGKRVVAFSGRFIECKGINFLLEAWHFVARDYPDAVLMVLGDGVLFEEMKNLSARLGIQGSVKFLGHVNNVTQYLHAADIYVLSSLQEGMPNALLEAMACGLAPVATRISGVVDLIEEGENGIIVQPGDAKGLAEGIMRLLRDSGLCRTMGTKAYRTIQGSYSLEEIAPRYRELYRKLMATESKR